MHGGVIFNQAAGDYGATDSANGDFEREKVAI